jgi:hypothetical protein
MLVLALAVSAQNAAGTTNTPPTAPTGTEASSSCDNAFINKMRNSNDALVSSIPIQGNEPYFLAEDETYDGICHREWNTYGRCCEPSKVEEAAKGKFRRWAAQYKKFIGKIKFGARIAKRLDRLALMMEDVKTHVDSSAGSNTSEITDAAKTQFNAFAQKFSKLLAFFDPATFEKQKAQFEATAEKCFQVSRNLKAAMFCGRCSGRGADFLDAAGKMYLDKDGCLSVVRQCVKPWLFSFQFSKNVKALKLLFKLRKHKKAKAQANNTPNAAGQAATEQIDAITNENGEDNTDDADEIIVNLRTCSKMKPEALKLDEMTKAVCEDLFTPEEENEDLTGNPDIIDEVEQEDAEEEKEFEALPADDREAIKVEIAKKKTAREQEFTRQKTAAENKMNELRTEITNTEAELENAKIEIDQKKAQLKTKKERLANIDETQKAQLMEEIKGLRTAIKNRSKQFADQHEKIQTKIKTFVQETDENALPEDMEEVTGGYFKKFEEGGGDDVFEEEERQNEEQNEEFLMELEKKQRVADQRQTELKAKFEELKQEMDKVRPSTPGTAPTNLDATTIAKIRAIKEEIEMKKIAAMNAE